MQNRLKQRCRLSQMRGDNWLDILLYGAGVNGKKCIKKIVNLYADEVHVIGIMDEKKTGIIKDTPVFSIAELMKREEKESILKVPVVISIARRRTVLEVYKKLLTAGFSDIYFWLEKDSERSGALSFLEYECARITARPDDILPHVEVHAVDYCNLNCAGCTHFSPVYDKRTPDIFARLDGIRKIKNITSNVLSFYVLGGEPLLCDDLAQYIETARNCFPFADIRVVTNGLLIPTVKQTVLDTFSRNHVVVDISEYQPVHQKIDKIKNVLRNNRIDYCVRRLEKKQKFIKPLALSTHSKYDKKCISDGCVSIKDDMIARCPTLMYVDILNQKYHAHFPTGGIYKIEEFHAPAELNEKMMKSVPLCEYCVNNEIDWHTCGKNMDISEFVTAE